MQVYSVPAIRRMCFRHDRKRVSRIAIKGYFRFNPPAHGIQGVLYGHVVRGNVPALGPTGGYIPSKGGVYAWFLPSAWGTGVVPEKRWILVQGELFCSSDTMSVDRWAFAGQGRSRFRPAPRAGPVGRPVRVARYTPRSRILLAWPHT